VRGSACATRRDVKMYRMTGTQIIDTARDTRRRQKSHLSTTRRTSTQLVIELRPAVSHPPYSLVVAAFTPCHQSITSPSVAEHLGHFSYRAISIGFNRTLAHLFFSNWRPSVTTIFTISLEWPALLSEFDILSIHGTVNNVEYGFTSKNL